MVYWKSHAFCLHNTFVAVHIRGLKNVEFYTQLVYATPIAKFPHSFIYIFKFVYVLSTLTRHCFVILYTYNTQHITPLIYSLWGVRILHNNTGDKRISAAKVDYIFYLAKISLSFIAKN